VIRHSPLALLLDLDGTLVPFAERPDLAQPQASLIDLLQAAASMPGLLTVVVSGRPRSDLERWFGGTPSLWLAAEHGAFLRGDGSWVGSLAGHAPKLDDLQVILETIAKRTPGALVERKVWTVAFHHRGVGQPMKARVCAEVEASIQAWLQAHGDYESLSGAAVIEVRPTKARKSVVVEWVRQARGPETRIVALGDDITDEDMFGALGAGDEAVLVARSVDRMTAAAWTLAGPEESARFVRWICAVRSQEISFEAPAVPRRLAPRDPPSETESAHDLLVISNRLRPLRAPVAPGDERRRPVGGLVAALEPVLQARGGMWLGWSGRSTPDEDFGPIERSDGTRPRLAWFDLPVAVQEAYYNGFCNRSLWPLLHTLPERVRFVDAEWEAYLAVNERVAEAALELASPHCAIWAHDFHLLRVASGLRRRGHGGPLGLFLHVPFPCADVFALNPWARQLLEGMLTFDLVGFQTQHDVRNFLQTVGAMSPATVSDDVVEDRGRRVRVGAFPIGIIPEAFEPPPEDEDREETTALLRMLAGRRLILGVDRLDYTKGIPERLEAFAQLLAISPEWRGKVSFLQISVPSRVDVIEYQQERLRIEAAVGRINGELGEADWTPVRYLFRSYPRSELSRFYREADVCLVTPLRDGMNLVAKEFVAAQDTEKPGVLVLSLFAGAAHELTDAILTNPLHLEGMARDMDRALRLSPDERRNRHARLLAAVHRTTATSWAESFVMALEACRGSAAPSH
jgi:trehalose 6-phosphate synthase